MSRRRTATLSSTASSSSTLLAALKTPAWDQPTSPIQIGLPPSEAQPDAPVITCDYIAPPIQAHVRGQSADAFNAV